MAANFAMSTHCRLHECKTNTMIRKMKNVYTDQKGYMRKFLTHRANLKRSKSRIARFTCLILLYNSTV